ncbi:DNA-directed RNA polymerase I subunit RPA49-like [Uloborus diversus]|uniref:DNA-directed RNA polymerase I subunit RPA49-like n=1 Tax=Uloborus diversus TaxID=327109 RepID=UPI002408F44D|nr:DNA-directed RNA polymerase I subunit RPA49-like [Uloborus diversus]
MVGWLQSFRPKFGHRFVAGLVGFCTLFILSYITTNIGRHQRFPHPVIGFSNGNIKPSKIGCLSYTSYRSSEKFRTRPKKILVVNNGRLTYVGYNYNNELTNVTSSVLKIGLYNKSKKEMTMYDVDVFFLKPLLKCTLKIENIGKSFVEKADDLALSFGSKSIQTFVKSRNKQGQLNLSSLESISVKSIDEGLKAMTSDMQQDTTTTPSIFPQPNENATDVSQIYNLHDILQTETYDALEAESNIFLNVTRQQIELWKQENKYCEFITKFLEFNLTSMNAHKSKLLLYLHYMTCFLRLTYLDWRKKDPLPEVPQVFKKELMDKFVINKPGTRQYLIQHPQRYQFEMGTWTYSWPRQIERELAASSVHGGSPTGCIEPVTRQLRVQRPTDQAIAAAY